MNHGGVLWPGDWSLRHDVRPSRNSPMTRNTTLVAALMPRYATLPETPGEVALVFSIYTLEAITASLVILASLWPMARVGQGIAQDIAEHGHRLTAALALCVIVALGLRFLLANPTLLVHYPSLDLHLDRLFHPLGPARTWHSFHGMGGFVIHAGAARAFGESLEVVWSVNRLVDSLAVVLMYAFVRSLFSSVTAGILAAALLAVFPLQIRVAASEQLASVTVFFVLLAYVSVLHALRLRDRFAYLSAALALAAAAQMRAAVVLHLGFCVLLVLLRVRREPWPRLDRWFFTALGLLLVLCVPRVISSLHDAEQFGGWFRLDLFFDVFASWRHLYINADLAWPLYPILTVVGLGFLIAERRFRLLAFFGVALLSGWLFVLNQWNLDVLEALRFQAQDWFLVVALAGHGLARVVTMPQPVWGRLIALGAAFLLAVGTVLSSRDLLIRIPSAAQDAIFFASALPSVPRDCELHILVPAPKGDRVYGAGGGYLWAMRPLGRRALAYPGDLSVRPDGTCRVAYVGVPCVNRYPSDEPDLEQKWYREHQAGVGPGLHRRVDAWLARLDTLGTQERPECLWLRQHFHWHPLVTTTVTPGPRSFVWTPRDPVTVGFYRLHPRTHDGSLGQ